MKPPRKYHRPPMLQHTEVPPGKDLVRILVLDDTRDTLERLENALWIWPHRIAKADSIDQAVKMCAHLRPTAVMADVRFRGAHNGRPIETLRMQLPDVAIIAIASNTEKLTQAQILDQGADACLLREELHRPTLHDLLRSIQRQSPMTDQTICSPMSRIPLPWKHSRMIGTLICDISGGIAGANQCLADWLDYKQPGALRDKCVWRDVLASPGDWPAWKEIAGDTNALLHQSITVQTRNGQLLWMQVEVFAAPRYPAMLQAAFVDQTELALLTGRTTTT